MSTTPATIAPAHFSPSWQVTTAGGATTSTCSCGWSHTGPDANLATIARVAHELDHRRRASGSPSVADLLEPGENRLVDVLGRLTSTGMTRERAVAAVLDALERHTVTLTPQYALRRA